MTENREEVEGRLAAADREADDVQRQLTSVRQDVATEVEKGWTSPWKSPDTVDAKIRAWLAGNGEYQALRVRQRDLEERRRSLLTQLGAPPAAHLADAAPPEKGPTP